MQDSDTQFRLSTYFAAYGFCIDAAVSIAMCLFHSMSVLRSMTSSIATYGFYSDVSDSIRTCVAIAMGRFHSGCVKWSGLPGARTEALEGQSEVILGVSPLTFKLGK